MMAFGTNAYALPVGGAVTAGGASISSGAAGTTITQSTPERGNQLAELQYRAERSCPVRAAQQQFGGAQPGAGFRSFEHPGQSVGQRQSIPGESERHPVRQGGIGQCRRAGRLHAEHHRQRFHGGHTTSFPVPAMARSSTRDRSTPTAAMWRCWARTSAMKA